MTATLVMILPPSFGNSTSKTIYVEEERRPILQSVNPWILYPNQVLQRAPQRIIPEPYSPPRETVGRRDPLPVRRNDDQPVSSQFSQRERAPQRIIPEPFSPPREPVYRKDPLPVRRNDNQPVSPQFSQGERVPVGSR